MLVPALFAIALACRGDVSTGNAVFNAADATLAVRFDSATVRASNAPLASWRAGVVVTVTNTSAFPLYLQRLCQTGSTPGGVLVRPPGNSAKVAMFVGGMCNASLIPDDALLAPIPVAVGASYTWTLGLQSLGNVPIADATGEFQVVLDIIAANHKGSQVKPADTLTTAKRTSATLTILTP